MKILFMSCKTGGGHNAASKAVMEEMESRGHEVVLLDPYTLKGKDLDRKVGNGYVKMVQLSPKAFGVVYFLGDCYRHLPFRSPVYAVNKAMTDALKQYLEMHSFDAIVLTHLFPGEILLGLKNKGVALPPILFISTDYVCQPFTEEIAADYYIIPSPLLIEEYTRYGLPIDRTFCFGIPVMKAFSENVSKQQAKIALGLDPMRRYFLLTGGSMGAGKLSGTVDAVLEYLKKRKDTSLIVICGENPKLIEKYQKRYAAYPEVIILGSTDKMALYLKASDIYFSKPGGLSCTEAAVVGIPLLHVTPIPGCESRNMAFFADHGMSIPIKNSFGKLLPAIEKLEDPAFAGEMIRKQNELINKHSAVDIGNFIEKLAIHQSSEEKAL